MNVQAALFLLCDKKVLSQQQINLAFIQACRRGDPHIKSFFALTDVNPNDCIYTPLMEASIGGHADTVSSLLAAGADVNFCAPCGNTALTCASTADVVHTLLAAGATLGVDYNCTALYMAADRHQWEVVEAIVSSAQFTDFTDKDYHLDDMLTHALETACRTPIDTLDGLNTVKGLLSIDAKPSARCLENCYHFLGRDNVPYAKDALAALVDAGCKLKYICSTKQLCLINIVSKLAVEHATKES